MVLRRSRRRFGGVEGADGPATRGLVKGWVDSVWAIEQFEEAFRKTATGRARGKVVIKIAEEDV